MGLPSSVHSPQVAWTSTCHTPIFLIYLYHSCQLNNQNLIFIVLILSYFCDSFAASSHNTQKPLHLVFQDVKDTTSISPLGNSPRGLPPSCFKRFYFLSRSAMKLLSWDFSINWHLPLRMRCFLNPMFSSLLLVCLLILVQHIIHSFLRKAQVHKNVWDSPCFKTSLLNTFSYVRV